MLNLTLNVGKKRTAVIVIIGILIIIMLFELCIPIKAKTQKFSGATNEQRIEFIEWRGHNVIDNPIGVKTIVIPQVFSDVYNNYNALQRKIGLDLEKYKGKTVVLYTYSALGYDTEVHINLLVYNDIIIGGDISSVELNGFMNSL